MLAKLSRRTFLAHTARFALAAGSLRSTLGRRRDKLRLAAVGLGVQSGGDLAELRKHPDLELVALCDVDESVLHKRGEALAVPIDARFVDYRELMRKHWASIDAVHIATPDHMHAAVALEAIAHGMHVYLQKPLTRFVAESRVLAQAARKRPGLATQMGIQIQAHQAYRTAVAWLRAGVLGRVQAVHAFCGKGWGGPSVVKPPQPIPAGLHWDLYCGVSPLLPHVAEHHREGNWRKLAAFGTGTLGDMACHILDPIFGGLDLRTAKSVQSKLAPPQTADSFPYDAHVIWRMAGSERTTDDFGLHWYHGDQRPPAELSQRIAGGKLPGGGSLILGERGAMLLPHWQVPRLFDSQGVALAESPPTEPKGNHYFDWVDAALGRAPLNTGAAFDFAAPLTETILLGNVAMWWPDQELAWDSARGEFTGTGAAPAQGLIAPHYRECFEVPFLRRGAAR